MTIEQEIRNLLSPYFHPPDFELEQMRETPDSFLATIINFMPDRRATVISIPKSVCDDKEQLAKTVQLDAAHILTEIRRMQGGLAEER